MMLKKILKYPSTGRFKEQQQKLNEYFILQ